MNKEETVGDQRREMSQPGVSLAATRAPSMVQVTKLSPGGQCQSNDVGVGDRMWSNEQEDSKASETGVV